MLEALRRPTAAPRKPAAVQLYLAEHKERIREIYDVRVDTSQKKGIALCNQITDELLKAESDEVKAEWDKKAEQEYAQLIREYAAAQRGEPCDDPEAQEE